VACNQDNASSVCGGGECVPFAVSCHTRNLPAGILDRNGVFCPDPGPAGSSDECKLVRKTPCTVIGSGEASCGSDSCP
jgi:hypothetical protein